MTTLKHYLDPRVSIRARIALSFGAVGLAIAVVGGLYSGARQESQLREQLGAQQRQIAMLAGDTLARGPGERPDDLVFAGSPRSLREADGDPATLRRQREHLDDLQRWHSEFVWLGFTDETGRVRSASGGILEGVDASSRPWFTGARGRSYFGDLHDAPLLRQVLARAQDEPTRLLDLAVAVPGADGALRGVLAAHLSDAWMRARLAGIKAGSQNLRAVEILLVGRDGTVLASSEPPGATAEKTVEGQWRDSPSGHAVTTMGGREYLAGFHRVQPHGDFIGFGWTIVARQDADLALLPAARARDAALILAVTLALLFAAIGWVIAGRISGPLERMTRAVEARRDRDAPLGLQDVRGEDEIGTLAARLESLVDGLREDEARIREREAELTKLVETMVEGVVRFDAEGRITMLNAAGERILGARRVAVLGRHFTDVPWRRIGARGELRVEDHPFSRIRAGAERVEGVTFDIVAGDGRTTTISLSAAALRDDDGNFAGVVASYADISERKRSDAALRRSERLQSAVVSTALDAIVTIDHRGRIVEFNPAAERCFGYERERALGCSMAELLVPDEMRSQHRAGFDRALATGEMRMGGRRVELPALRGDGTRIEVELAIIRMPEEEPALFTAFARDITERKRAEAAARNAQERLDRALRASHVALFEVDLETGAVLLGESWSVMRGGPSVPTQTTVPELVRLTHPDDREPLRALVKAAIRGERDAYESEHRVATLAGEWIWIISRASVVERSASGRAVRLTGTNVDITERKRAEQRIHYLNTRDALTDLSNRALFADRLEAAVDAARRGQERLALLCIGLDRFTAINDSLGHDYGDEVLKAVAGRIAAASGPDDVVGRPGGDEFLVLLRRVDSPGVAMRTAEAMRAAVSSPMRIGASTPVVRMSVGIAMYPDDGETSGVLLRHAGTALNVAKVDGGNRAHFFAARMNADARARFELESQLRLALERDELLLHYQPQVELASGAVVGWEALVRWRHPERGLLYPDVFLPVADASGLIVALGEQVMLRACRQAAAWRSERRPARMAVNVSAQQFRHPGFLKSVRSALVSTGLDAKFLELEIVENSILGKEPAVDAVLEALGAQGVELAVDDFGTGYSNLSYLKRLPIDTVKIDQSFVRDVPASPEACAIVHAVIAMAHGLGLRVVAEGIETPAQLEFLRQSGCDRGQGYFFGRPETAEHWSGRGDNVLPLRRPDSAAPAR